MLDKPPYMAYQVIHERRVPMNSKFWTKIILIVVSILAGVGMIPTWIGMASNVVLEEMSRIEVSQDTFETLYATVDRVVDGDTISVIMHDALATPEMLRLIGVDTPETVHPAMPIQFFGPEATIFVNNLCNGEPVKLHLQRDRPRRGSYGRLLVYVELPDGSILNELILQGGFGYSYTKYSHANTDRYNDIERSARIAKRGLWASVKFDDLPKWLQTSNPGILEP